MTSPATVIGEWLAIEIGRNRSSVDKVRIQLSDAEEVGVIDEAFRQAVRMRFRPGCSLAEIQLQVAGIRQRYGDRKLPLEPIELELLVRDELGETVPLGGLVPESVFASKVLMLEQLAFNMGLIDEEIDDLVGSSEPVRGT